MKRNGFGLCKVLGGHSITDGIPEYIELENEEIVWYGEHFDIPEPDELVFISWFKEEKYSVADLYIQKRKWEDFLL